MISKKTAIAYAAVLLLLAVVCLIVPTLHGY